MTLLTPIDIDRVGHQGPLTLLLNSLRHISHHLIGVDRLALPVLIKLALQLGLSGFNDGVPHDVYGVFVLFLALRCPALESMRGCI